MFFLLSKLLLFLLNPLVWLSACLIYAVWTKKSKRRYRSLISATAILLIFSNQFLCNQVFKWWETPPTTIKETYEVAILLGGYYNNGGLPEDGRFTFGDAANRFTQTFELYQDGKVERILLTGGRSDLLERNELEAPKASQLLQKFGVPDSVIIVEPNARNTYENAIFTKQLLDSLGYQKCLLVTSAFHMRRARACFDKADVNYTIYPTGYHQIQSPSKLSYYLQPNASTLSDWSLLLKEWVGYISYKMMDYA